MAENKAGCFPGTDILIPLLTDVQMYGELFGISRDSSEKFYWYYDAVGWMLPNGNLVRNWRSKLRQWNVENRVFDKQQKDRDEKREAAANKTHAGTAQSKGDILINGTWWYAYDWYLAQVQENRTKAQKIINIKYEGSTFFRYP